MGNYNRDDRSGDRRNFKRRDFGSRGGDRSEMNPAVCSKCGKNCEVPFKPTGERPVYCSDCFRTNRSSDSHSSGGMNSGRSSYNDRPMYDAVCDKCGSNCKLPFQPKGGKPVYCSRCFDDVGGGKEERGKGQNSNNLQYEQMNSKLDKILKILSSDCKCVKEDNNEIKIEDLVIEKAEQIVKEKVKKKKGAKKKPPDKQEIV
jgi:CxxC-x17-CxxC domain-containing protein